MRRVGNLKFTVWDREGTPWFVAKEVADILDLKAPWMSEFIAKNLEASERIKVSSRDFGNTELRGNGPRWFISESGLYKLIMRSNKPDAKVFQDWVTKEVIPTIRKDGGYILGEEKVATGEISEDELGALKLMVLRRVVDAACFVCNINRECRCSQMGFNHKWECSPRKKQCDGEKHDNLKTISL